MQKFICTANLSKDVEKRETNNGKAVANFSIAVARFGGEGADFVPVQVWNKAAENLVKFQVKGSQIAVNGRLNVETYETYKYDVGSTSEGSYEVTSMDNLSKKYVWFNSFRIRYGIRLCISSIIHSIWFSNWWK